MANLLLEQKAAIIAAMPAGLSDLIESNGFERVTGTAQAGQGAGWGAAHRPSLAARTMPDRARTLARRADGGLSLRQAMALLVAGLAITGVWQRLHEGAVQRPAALVVDNVDLASEVRGGIGRIDQLLAGVTDVASAEAALTPLQNISRSVSKLQGLAAELPAPNKTTLANLTADAIPTRRAGLDKAYAIPGVAAVLEPVVDPLMTAIGNRTKGPA